MSQSPPLQRQRFSEERYSLMAPPGTAVSCFREVLLGQGRFLGDVSGSSLAEKVVVPSLKGGQAMNFYTIVMTGLVVVGSASLAAANPAMLPKHPGLSIGRRVRQRYRAKEPAR